MIPAAINERRPCPRCGADVLWRRDPLPYPLHPCTCETPMAQPLGPHSGTYAPPTDLPAKPTAPMPIDVRPIDRALHDVPDTLPACPFCGRAAIARDGGAYCVHLGGCFLTGNTVEAWERRAPAQAAPISGVPAELRRRMESGVPMASAPTEAAAPDDDRETVGKCESCACTIYDGDDYRRWADDVLTCKACTDKDDAHEKRAKAAAPVCATCRDTHRMPSGHLCTRCPIPCDACRGGGHGPYCEQTPCACACHRRAPAQAAAPAPCVCGDPAATGTVHRTDGPCYVAQAAAPAAEERCDPEVYEKGQCVCIMAGPRASVLNEIARRATEKVQPGKIDWHYVGGRAVFKTTGDLQAAADAIASQIPQIMWRGASPDRWAQDQGRPAEAEGWRALRPMRIEALIYMRDMAAALDVLVPYLSDVEVGKQPMPADWPERYAKACAEKRAAGDGWIACSERMPEPGFYLVMTTNRPHPRVFEWYNVPASQSGHWRDENDDRSYCDVTAWRPLPAPPRAEGR